MGCKKLKEKSYFSQTADTLPEKEEEETRRIKAHM